MCSKYSTVLYDADMTLLDFKKSQGVALKELFKYAGIDYSKDRETLYDSINNSFWKRLELGIVDRSEVKVGRFRELFKAVGYEGISPDEAHSFYENALSLNGFLIEGAKEHLEKVSGKHSLYMITNGTKTVQERRLDSTDIRKYFEDIFISEDTGFEKPSVEYFNVVFDKMKHKDKSKMIIVGDSLSSDIKGGVNTGIDTIWFNPQRLDNKTEIIPTYTAYCYEDIEKILATEH